ncbi:hypothetical protein B5X24_HaOG208805 [Helicoverpa armigera]|uniref:Uncharacterized protein n=1 Tax=Helicoverpa armigera TaxID=29058 RepID=A0A2W1BQ01_HELAM|nr:hypothetical protein B5X24_HaOG208805 [Helicoverpa armigera]
MFVKVMFKKKKLNCGLKIGLCIYVILILTIQTDCKNIKVEDPTTHKSRDTDEVFIVHPGKYSPVPFQYEREQWMNAEYVDVCYDDYTKCMTSQISPTPVCVFHKQSLVPGQTEYKYQTSYCDSYMENCRIGYRYWRLLGFGKCDLTSTWVYGENEIIEI